MMHRGWVLQYWVKVNGWKTKDTIVRWDSTAHFQTLEEGIQFWKELLANKYRFMNFPTYRLLDLETGDFVMCDIL